MKEAYQNAVDKIMCSELCPCEIGPNSSNKKLWRWLGHSVLRFYGRASDKKIMTEEERLD